MADNQAVDEEEKEDWAKSRSKAILRAGILAGEITPEMQPLAVFKMNPGEHGKWTYPNWRSNLRTLRLAIGRDRNRMTRDAISYGHDLAIVKSLRSPDAKTPWHRSPAYPLLKQDVDEGKHKTMKPMLLRESRPEYSAFDLTVFRKHLYQEIDSRPKREIRYEKKKHAWKYPELHPARLDEGDQDA
jgi:hypothetical protein